MGEQTRRGWWQDVYRWGQINLREIDPLGTDARWWADYWAECGVGAVTINAGGIVAYYPTEIEHHRRSPHLGERDLFGDLLTALRAKGIRVLARFSATRQHAGMYYAHPDWFARDDHGQPMTELPVGREVLYHVCNTGPFHHEWLPSVIDEVLRKYGPDGIFCNVWVGPRGVCYCPRCRRLFREATGCDLPAKLTPDDPADLVSRRYTDWRYRLNLQWVDFMRERVKAHNPEATFIVNQHSWTGSAGNWEDLRAIARRSDVIDADFQGRGQGESAAPIWSVGENGRILRAAVGRRPGAAVPCGLTGAFEGWRLAAKRDEEQTIWLADMAASAARVWLHFVGAASGGLHDDSRRFAAPRAYLRWHRENEDCFRDLDSLAEVAVLLSKPTTDYYAAGGRYYSARQAGERAMMTHLRGVGWSLLRAGMPYDFLHDQDLEEADGAAALARYRVLVLPNVACLSDNQAAVIRDWVRAGGGVVATYETGCYTEDLQPRPDSALAEVFGATGLGNRITPGDHWYIRLEEPGAPLTASLSGGSQDPSPDTRHPTPNSQSVRFVGASGDLLAVELANGATAGLTFLPPIPSMPPEAPYFTVERTTRPCAVLHRSGEGRSVYFPFALDALAWRRNHPDHADLLVNAVRWAAGWIGDDGRPTADGGLRTTDGRQVLGGKGAVWAEASGLVDAYPYRQPDGRMVVHLVNVGHAGAWRGPIDRLTPVGPVVVSVSERVLGQARGGQLPSEAKLRRIGERVAVQPVDGGVRVAVPAIRDFEVVCLE